MVEIVFKKSNIFFLWKETFALVYLTLVESNWKLVVMCIYKMEAFDSTISATVHLFWIFNVL